MAHVATVTIDSDQVPADATNFPAYINLAHLFAGSASFASTVANGGGDIRVFQGASELAREVVSCRPGTFFDFSGSSLPTGFSNTTDTWLAASDYIRPGGSTGRNIFADFGAADGTAIGIVNNTTALAGHYGGLLFRQYDADNYWVTDIDFNAGSLRLYKRVAGSATVVDTASVSVSLNTEHEVKVLFSGNDITVYLDGVAKITATDSFNASATTHGLRGNQTGLRFYEFHFIAEQETTGTGELHVLIPFLDSSQDTVLSIYADGSSADYAVDDPFGRNAVWSTFSHKQIGGDDATGSSTLTLSGNTALSGTVNGFDALDFDGNAIAKSLATFSGTASDDWRTNDITLSAWVNADSVSAARAHIIAKRESSIQEFALRLDNANPEFLSGGTAPKSSGSISVSTDAHLVVTRIGGNVNFYINGAFVDAVSVTNSPSISSGDLSLGGPASSTTASDYFNGRIALAGAINGTALSPQWITTEYNNQSDPSLFYTATDPNAGGGGTTNYDVSMAVAGSAGFSHGATADALADMAIAGSAGATYTAQAAFSVSIAQGATAGAAMTGAVDAVADIAADMLIAANVSATATAEAQALAAMVAGVSGGLAMFTGTSLDASMSLSAAAGVSMTATIGANVTMDAGATGGLSVSSAAAAYADMQISAEAAAALIAAAATEAGITVEAVHNITTAGTSLSGDVVTPDRRTFSVTLELRDFSVPAESNTFTVH
jgi:hypothetical protein